MIFRGYIALPDVYLPHRMIFRDYIALPDVYLPHRMIFRGYIALPDVYLQICKLTLSHIHISHKDIISHLDRHLEKVLPFNMPDTNNV